MIDCLCTKSWTDLQTLLTQENITDLFQYKYLQSSSCLSSSCPPVAPALCSFFFSIGGLSEVNRMFVQFITFLRLKYFTVIGSVQVNLSFIYYTALQCTGLIQTYSVFYQSHVDLPTLVKGNQETHGKKKTGISNFNTVSSKCHKILCFPITI